MAKNKPIVWSPRSILAIATAHLCKINLFHGAVRSSKSYTADYIAIRKEISKLPPCNVLVSGFSSDSAKQNIVAEWEKKLKAEFKEHKNAKGNYFTIPIKGLHDKRFYIRGGGKNGDEKGIKGVTLGYWYADEITECTEEFIKMAISRLSLPFSKAIWTTNPSNPTNYIKTNYLDKEKLGVLKGIFQSFQFEMFDNPMLPAEYIKEAYTTYHGVFFQRNVLGKWVAAEGHIYTMCDDDNITNRMPSNPEKIFIGIDYGTSNMTVFLKVYYRKGVFTVVDEYSHSGSESQNYKTPSQYVEDLKDFIGEDSAFVTAVYADPSANFFIQECKKSGIKGFKSSVNDIIPGIQLMQNLFGMKKILFKMGKTIKCLMQLQGYKWDKANEQRGKDVPLKENDHFCDCLRYIVSSSVKNKSVNAYVGYNKRQANRILTNY